MSGLRDLVTGSDACGPGDGAGPSNAAASLAEALLGGRAKHAAQVQEVRVCGGGECVALGDVDQGRSDTHGRVLALSSGDSR